MSNPADPTPREIIFGGMPDDARKEDYLMGPVQLTVAIRRIAAYLDEQHAAGRGEPQPAPTHCRHGVSVFDRCVYCVADSSNDTAGSPVAAPPEPAPGSREPRVMRCPECTVLHAVIPAESWLDDLLDALSDGLTLEEDGVLLGEDAGLLIEEAFKAQRGHAAPVAEPAPGDRVLCCSGGCGKPSPRNPTAAVKYTCYACAHKPDAPGSNDLNQTGEPELVEPPVPVAGGTERILVNGVSYVVLRDKREREREPPVPVAGLREYDLRVFHLTGELSAVSKEASEHATARIELLRERDEALAQVEALRSRLVTIVDEACGLQPVDTSSEDLFTLLEKDHHDWRMRASAAANESLRLSELFTAATCRAEAAEARVRELEKELAAARGMTERPILVGSVWSAGSYRVRVTGLDDSYVSYRVEARSITGSGTYTRASFVKSHTHVSDPEPPAAVAGESGEGRA